jgi:hypothetical protein
MSKLLETKWLEFRDATVQGSPDEPAARYFFFAGMQVMYKLVSDAPQNDIARALYLNELQHELLEDIRAHQESLDRNPPAAG